MSKFLSGRPHIALLLLLASLAGFVELTGQTPQQSRTLESAAAASRQSSTLSADIQMTWTTGGDKRQTSGSIQLSRPNLGRIVFQGEYPEVLLVSDGQKRYLAPNDNQFQQTTIDAKGLGIDSPWWGLPFRFFFSQSVNPFGATPDASATYQDEDRSAGVDGLHVVTVRGNSPMGGYIETLSFNSTGDLVESSVQFGEGVGAALFRAKLTNIRHSPIAAATFRFKAKAGQIAAGSEDKMLLLGVRAPGFTLPTAEGKTVSLDEQLRGRKAVLVNFWYYNCAPCRVEFPEFEKLYRQFASEGFTIVAVDKADSPAVVSRYARSAGLTFPVVLGGEVSKNSVFERYKVEEAFPGSYLLDGTGKIVYRSTGEDLAGLKQALSQLGFK